MHCGATLFTQSAAAARTSGFYARKNRRFVRFSLFLGGSAHRTTIARLSEIAARYSNGLSRFPTVSRSLYTFFHCLRFSFFLFSFLFLSFPYRNAIRPPLKLYLLKFYKICSFLVSYHCKLPLLRFKFLLRSFYCILLPIFNYVNISCSVTIYIFVKHYN